VRSTSVFEFPEEQEAQYRKARRLEWASVVYLASTALFIYLTMGSSQAMKTSFFEDLISLVPSLAFLVTTRLARRNPGPEYPYGHHGAVSIGFLVAALALVSMGSILLIEAVLKLVAGERPTLGGMTIFGHTVWAGWPMFAALAYAGVPSIFFGRAKLKLAPKFHDKTLFASSKMMKADWMTAGATAVGVLGMGLGYWWTDAVAAGLVSLDILHDGCTMIGASITDLMERRPEKTDGSGPEDLPEEVRRYLEGLDWVGTAEVRMREQGHIFFGEAFVTLRGAVSEDLPEKLERAVGGAKQLNWRLHDLVIMPVTRESMAEG
jgi:divalent metal cation (Fe/Co/Zn/Cd) transporter